MKSTVMELPERRTGEERRMEPERRGAAVSLPGARGISGARGNRSVFLEVAGSVIVAVLSLAVYMKTGLYSAAEGGAMRIGLGLLIASWFVLNFRVALHQR